MPADSDNGLSRPQSQTLEQLGIVRWVRRDEGVADRGEDEPVATTATGGAWAEGPPTAPAAAGAAPAWQALREEALGCTMCTLHRTRSSVVFGTGDPDAEWMVVGEAPGADEDRAGEPFVGRAGRLLNAMLFAAGFAREAVYIANILKCRPPDNRDPRPEESAACRGFLRRQIELVSPRLILCVGRVAAQNLLQDDRPLARLRGTVHRLPDTGTPVVVTYHPAYLLRSPLQKRRAWDDLCLARQVAAGVVEPP